MKSLVFLVMSIVAFKSFAATEVMRRNIRLPSQEVLNKYEVTPAAASATALASGLPSIAAATNYQVTTQPDFSRNLVVTPAGTTNDIAAGDVVVTGLDADGNVISETFSFLANATGAQTGNKAFLRVTNVLVPIGDSPFGGTFSIGSGVKLGLSKCLDGAGFFIKGMVDGAALTGSTVAANATSLSDNTVIPDPAPNGTRKFVLLFVQNFRCAE